MDVEAIDELGDMTAGPDVMPTFSAACTALFSTPAPKEPAAHPQIVERSPSGNAANNVFKPVCRSIDVIHCPWF